MDDGGSADSYDEMEDGLVVDFPSTSSTDHCDEGMLRRLNSDVFTAGVVAATPPGSKVDIKMTGSERKVSYSNCKFETHHHGDSPSRESAPTDTEITRLLDGKFELFKLQPLHPEAQVYGGRQTLSHGSRDVAIKLIPRQDDREKELQLHKNLHHSNIVQLIDCGFTPGPIDFTYVVMELCRHNLQEYVTSNQNKPVEFYICSSYSRQILLGLDYLQNQNIVHRDLRPTNILITRCGTTAKITDFKFARDLSKGDFPAKTRRICEGTNGYRAAELLKPNNPTGSFPADVFSYGLIVCYMFSKGRHPYGANRYKWAANIIDGKQLDLSIIPASVTRRTHLIKLLIGCLKHQSRARFTVDTLLQHSFFTQNFIPGRQSSSRDRGTSPKTRSPTSSKSSQSCSALADFEFKGDSKRTPSKIRSASASSPNQKCRKDLFGATSPETKVSPRGSEIKRSLKKSFSYLGLEEIAGRVDELEKLGDHKNLDTALQMAGCELHLNRGREESSIQRVKELLPSFQSPLRIRLEADEYSLKKRYSSALILYRISTEQYLKQDNSPNDLAEWIKRIADGVSEACVRHSYDGSASQGVAVNYGAKYLEGLLEVLRSTKDLNSALASVTEDFCQRQINKIYRQSKDNDLQFDYAGGIE